MSAITEHTPLEVLLNDPVMHAFNWSFIEKCNAELAALRAEVTALQQAVTEARDVIESSRERLVFEDMLKDDDSYLNEWWIINCDDWLAAHPAPEQVTPQPVNAFEAIAKWMDTQKDLTA